MSKEEIHPEVRKYFSRISGGKVKSEKKTNAVRKNGTMPCATGKFRGRPKKKYSAGSSWSGVKLVE